MSHHPAETDDEAAYYRSLTEAPNADSAAVMKHAHLRPVIEVECKLCPCLLGYERNRGDAWVVFFAHWNATHLPHSGS